MLTLYINPKITWITLCLPMTNSTRPDQGFIKFDHSVCTNAKSPFWHLNRYGFPLNGTLLAFITIISK